MVLAFASLLTALATFQHRFEKSWKLGVAVLLQIFTSICAERTKNNYVNLFLKRIENNVVGYWLDILLHRQVGNMGRILVGKVRTAPAACIL